MSTACNWVVYLLIDYSLMISFNWYSVYILVFISNSVYSLWFCCSAFSFLCAYGLFEHYLNYLWCFWVYLWVVFLVIALGITIYIRIYLTTATCINVLPLEVEHRNLNITLDFSEFYFLNISHIFPVFFASISTASLC